MDRFPVLMYHRLESPDCPVADPDERGWAVPVDGFARQMDRLRELDRIGVSMDQIHRTLESGTAVPPEWVAVTFDDGNLSDHVHAVPLLLHRGFRATFFVCGERVDADGGLSQAMIRAMHDSGMHVGSHAMTHRFMSELAAAEEEAELRSSRELLESITGEAVAHFAPPGGRWSRRTAAALRNAGYAAVSTSRYGFNAARGRRFAYRRLPVVRATSPARFDAMVRARPWRLFPGYARSASLSLARSALGEAGYRRVRGIQERA